MAVASLCFCQYFMSNFEEALDHVSIKGSLKRQTAVPEEWSKTT